jgi:DNA-binding PadR family transcriptional regulator
LIILLILGLLKQNPGAHGYELLSLMEEKHYKYIVNFTKGSFYYNLGQLVEKKYIVKVDQKDNTRETHNYNITELGEKEFEKLMFKYGTKTDYINLSFYVAMLFSDEYKKEELTKLIEIQIEQTKNKMSLIQLSLEHDENISSQFKKMLENSLSHHVVNVQWFEGLLEDIKK